MILKDAVRFSWLEANANEVTFVRNESGLHVTLDFDSSVSDCPVEYHAGSLREVIDSAMKEELS